MIITPEQVAEIQRLQAERDAETQRFADMTDAERAAAGWRKTMSGWSRTNSHNNGNTHA